MKSSTSFTLKLSRPAKKLKLKEFLRLTWYTTFPQTSENLGIQPSVSSVSVFRSKKSRYPRLAVTKTFTLSDIFFWAKKLMFNKSKENTVLI